MRVGISGPRAGVGHLLQTIFPPNDLSSRATRSEGPMRNYSNESTKFVVLGTCQDHGKSSTSCVFQAVESLRSLFGRGDFIGTSRYTTVHLHHLKRDVVLGVTVLDLICLALPGLRRHWRPMCRMSLASVRIG